MGIDGHQIIIDSVEGNGTKSKEVITCTNQVQDNVKNIANGVPLNQEQSDDHFYNEILKDFESRQKRVVIDYQIYCKNIFEEAKADAKSYFEDKETIKIKITETIGIRIHKRDKTMLEEFHGIKYPFFLYCGDAAIIGDNGIREEYKLKSYIKLFKIAKEEVKSNKATKVSEDDLELFNIIKDNIDFSDNLN